MSYITGMYLELGTPAPAELACGQNNPWATVGGVRLIAWGQGLQRISDTSWAAPAQLPQAQRWAEYLVRVCRPAGFTPLRMRVAGCTGHQFGGPLIPSLPGIITLGERVGGQANFTAQVEPVTIANPAQQKCGVYNTLTAPSSDDEEYYRVTVQFRLYTATGTQLPGALWSVTQMEWI